MQIPRHTPSPQHEQLRAFLYARASRDLKGRGSSTTAQMTENRREADDRGWLIVDEFTDDNRSASRYAKRERKRFANMVERVRAGEADVIVTWENSRLQRDLEVYVQIRQLCMETGTLWCYGGDVYDMRRRQDRKRTALDAVASEDEVEVIRDRNLRTVRLNAEAMRPHGRVPTGYQRRYDPDSGDLIDQIPDPVWAPVIRRIFDEFVAGTSPYSIARRLNADGITTSTGVQWREGGILAILTRPTYAGYRVFQGEIIGTATWDPLIDELTWQQARAILADPEQRRTRSNAVVHLLVGIARCGVCTGPLRAVDSPEGLKYGCRERFCTAIPAEVLQAYVEERLFRWLAAPEALAAFQDPDRAAEAETAVALVTKLTAELDAARAAAKAGTLSVASLIAVEAGTLPRLAKAQAAAEAFTVASPLLVSLMGCKDVEDRWGALVLEQQRSVLREVATITLNRAARKGDSTLRDGRVVMTLGPKRPPAQSSDATSTAPSNG
ncbi:recombinase family protein [Streptomyces sp. LS1784]|uniref:recombinase family protein n=1 Tax=Streptomyces sp. LS1784 TaxID=2851533 RepID=UPI001CCD8141|nr:recombinase family protein [Streptomyces sp. LS1784]